MKEVRSRGGRHMIHLHGVAYAHSSAANLADAVRFTAGEKGGRCAAAPVGAWRTQGRHASQQLRWTRRAPSEPIRFHYTGVKVKAPGHSAIRELMGSG